MPNFDERRAIQALAVEIAVLSRTKLSEVKGIPPTNHTLSRAINIVDHLGNDQSSYQAHLRHEYKNTPLFSIDTEGIVQFSGSIVHDRLSPRNIILSFINALSIEKDIDKRPYSDSLLSRSDAKTIVWPTPNGRFIIQLDQPNTFDQPNASFQFGFLPIFRS